MTDRPEAASATDGPEPALILVVDDQKVHRDKLAFAIRALGHEVETVDSGARAVARLAAAPADLVLLDILMPDMDGFEVMRFMQRDRRMSDIPVIVVSALEDDMSSVVRAIEMGAEDMLPKRVDPVLLCARLESALSDRQRRLREREHRAHMTRLLDAAAVLERHPVDPSRLGLDTTCEREDALGRLARVFVAMTDRAHDRSARLQAQLDRLRSAGLVLAAGALLGLCLPLAHGTLMQRPASMGVALWLSCLVLMLCLAALPWQERSDLRPRESVRPALLLSVSGGLCALLPMLWLLGRLPPITVAAMLPAELAIAMALRALLQRRRVTWRGWSAAAVALAAVALLFTGPAATALGWQPTTLGIAALVPVGLAVAAEVVARSFEHDPTATSGTSARANAIWLLALAALFTAIALVPAVVLTDGWVSVFDAVDRAATGVPVVGVSIALLAIALTAGAVLRTMVTALSGTVAAAMTAVVAAIGTIGWSMLLLGHSVPTIAGVSIGLSALACLLLGSSAVARRRVTSERLDVELA